MHRMTDATVPGGALQEERYEIFSDAWSEFYSTFSASANPNEDWTKISDLAERRRIQNRIAQRNYGKKLKKRLEELERRAAALSPTTFVDTPGFEDTVGEPTYEDRPPRLNEYLSPSSSTYSPKSASSYEIPGFLDGRRRINALGDYCAKYNFMNEDFAARSGFTINRNNVSSVVIGSGQKIKTTGTMQARFRFQDEAQAYPLQFHLLPSCIHDVILGRSFLKATETFSSLTNLARRVKQRVSDVLSSYNFLYLGDSAPRFTGHVNGTYQEALADSGARVLVMDEDYARSIKLSIMRDREHCTQLRFADGSTKRTSGMAFGVSWKFGNDSFGQEYKLDFHILKKAPANVILSDEFLFGTNAYSQYHCYLVDEDDEDDDAFFMAIDIDTTYLSSGATNPAGAEQLRELIRRGEEDDRIAALSGREQTTERAHADERRRQWVVHQLNASSTNTSASSDLTGFPCQVNSSGDASPRKTRWWFKLKPRSN